MKHLWKAWLLCGLLVLAAAGVVSAAIEPIPWEYNTTGVDRMPWLSGNTLYYVKDYDILQSTWDGKAWSNPTAVPGQINTSVNELNPVVLKGGTVMYFARVNGSTDYDFFRSEWDAAKQEWGEAVMIAPLSTPQQDWDIWVNEEETLAYVTTKVGYGGVAGLGGRDVWRSEKKDGVWSTPVNVGAPINTAKDEWHVFVDKAGKFYFEDEREGGMGGTDIWIADSLTGPVTNFAIVNSKASERAFTMSDTMIVFAADRRPGGAGGYDLFYLPLQ